MSDWWKKSVVYQIYPQSFNDSNNDGIGDIQGIIEKLPYLEELGVDVLWLNPIYVSPLVDNGYDIADYYKINPDYGTLDDFKELLEKAHEKKIKILSSTIRAIRINGSLNQKRAKTTNTQTFISGATLKQTVRNQTTGVRLSAVLLGPTSRKESNTICIFSPKNSPT